MQRLLQSRPVWTENTARLLTEGNCVVITGPFESLSDAYLTAEKAIHEDSPLKGSGKIMRGHF